MELVTIYNLSFPFGVEFTELSLLRLCKCVHRELPEVYGFFDYNIFFLRYSDPFELQNAIVYFDGYPLFGKSLRATAGPPPFYSKAFMRSLLPTRFLHVKTLTLDQFISIRQMNGTVTTQFDGFNNCLILMKDPFFSWIIQTFVLSRVIKTRKGSPLFFLIEKGGPEVI